MTKWQSVAVASSIALAIILLMGSAQAVVFVEHGVIFYPSGSNAKMSFTTDHTFNTVDVDATAAIFDGVRFEMGKTPVGNPATIQVSEWHPQENSGVVVNWTASGTPGSLVYVNVSGLQSINYTFYIDGNMSANLTGPSIHTSHTISSLNHFMLKSGPQIPEPPAPPASTSFDLTPIIPLLVLTLMFVGIGAFVAILFGRGKSGPP